MLPYDDRFDERQNLDRLAGHYEGRIRAIDALPSRAAEVDELQLKASAARAGAFLHDSSDIRGCDATTQKWRARCGAVGMLARPDQYWPRGKEPAKPDSIKVERGAAKDKPVSLVWR